PTPDPSLNVCVAEAGDLPLGDGSAPRNGLPVVSRPGAMPGAVGISRWVLLRGRIKPTHGTAI
ncbi:MAG TPA: hypothetical protein VMR94_11050, partial [Hyphomicrobiaceae bacterium]|nr:hypothetical protein [Hyphomicrobiaceae bacterium]